MNGWALHTLLNFVSLYNLPSNHFKFEWRCWKEVTKCTKSEVSKQSLILLWCIPSQGEIYTIQSTIKSEIYEALGLGWLYLWFLTLRKISFSFNFTLRILLKGVSTFLSLLLWCLNGKINSREFSFPKRKTGKKYIFLARYFALFFCS